MRSSIGAMRAIRGGLWLLGCVGAAGANAAELRDLRLVEGPDSTRVVFDLDAESASKVFVLRNPDRVVIDITGAKAAATFKPEAAKGLVKSVRTGPGANYLRVVLDTNAVVRPQDFGLQPAGGYGYRLIVDLYSAGSAAHGQIVAEGAEPAGKAAPHLPPAITVTSTPAPSAGTPPAAAESATGKTAETAVAAATTPSSPPSSPSMSTSPAAAKKPGLYGHAPPVITVPAQAPVIEHPAVAEAQPARSNVPPSQGAVSPAVVAKASPPEAVLPPIATSASTTSPTEKLLLGAKPIVVAVDAGHGGEDPGAHGPGGTLEKNVTLAIARKLARRINAQPGMKAVLTRDGDYYVGLRERTVAARQAQADLFVSIHCNAIQRRDMRGTAVYVLSDHGASNEQARWLANHENSADLVGGMKIKNKDDDLAAVLIDISQSATMEASFDLGSRMLESLGKVNVLQKEQVQQAGFLVLKSPDIPSVLVETAFISNPHEEKLLADGDYQDTLASSIFDGVHGYFARYRPQQVVAERTSTPAAVVPVSLKRGRAR